LLVVTVPVPLAATPPIATAQSFFRAILGFLGRGHQTKPSPWSGAPAPETSSFGVLAVETPDHPGGMNAVLRPLREAGINVHYLYPHLGRVSGQAIVILGVDRTEDAQKVLEQNWVRTLGKEVYNI